MLLFYGMPFPSKTCFEGVLKTPGRPLKPAPPILTRDIVNCMTMEILEYACAEVMVVQ